MRIAVLVLAFAICFGCGRRVTAGNERLPGPPTHTAPGFDELGSSNASQSEFHLGESVSLRSLAVLLVASSRPAAGWHIQNFAAIKSLDWAHAQNPTAPLIGHVCRSAASNSECEKVRCRSRIQMRQDSLNTNGEISSLEFDRRQLLSGLALMVSFAALAANAGDASAAEDDDVQTTGQPGQPASTTPEATSVQTNELAPELFRPTSNPPPLSMKTAQEKADAAKGESPTVDFGKIVGNSLQEAFQGGEAGAAAAVFNTFALQWLYTAMYYQRAYGGNLGSALEVLGNEGGISRLYQGFGFGLIEGPVLKFGDVAANVGILAFLSSIPETADLPTPIRTAAAALGAGLWRILCQPVDTSKVTLQVEGVAGWENLKKRVIEQGPGPLFQGSLASAAYTVIYDYPFFLTYNYLDGNVPIAADDDLTLTLARSALLGVTSSQVAGIVTNILGVIKTVQQTAGTGGKSSKKKLSIAEAASVVIEQDGWSGLVVRGLDTKLLTSAVQGVVLGFFLKYFQLTGTR